ncbi:Potassium channel GORK [Sesamum angolense]|uniref:Potassium channel GORK n=1 Tax=Sesamum angolense TaxID=2727404 RepID=A0AAE1XEU6_9LAMI|nr:Potassium channel GORK [Sesamum angolense]
MVESGPIWAQDCNGPIAIQKMSSVLHHQRDGFDMQMIGNFLSFASRGDRVGLNEMLRQGMSPNVQDYDNRTALHLAASEGHASIVELLLAYNANVNLRDRWQRTPLADAKLYQHRDICRILEVNGGRELIEDQAMLVRHEDDSQENIDISELNLEHSSTIEQLESRLDHLQLVYVMLDIARNLLLDEGQLSNISNNLDASYDTKKDIRAFGLIFYQMLEGKHITNMNSEYMHLKSIEFEKKFHITRCPGRILQLIEQCTSKDIGQRPSFSAVIEILEEVILMLKKAGCAAC